MYQQVLDPVAHSLAWSSLVAAIPLLVLFILLGMLRVTAWIASLVSLAVSIVIAPPATAPNIVFWRLAIMLRCVEMAPLGRPVVPDV